MAFLSKDSARVMNKNYFSARTFLPTRVDTYSGYRADEYPRAFYFNNQRLEIEEIIDRWQEGPRLAGGEIIDYFKVKASDDHFYFLKYFSLKDAWFLKPL